MTAHTPKSIIELWPTLSPEKQAALLDIAETVAASVPSQQLTADERGALNRSRDDFKADRVLDEDAYAGRMDAFMARLEAKSQSGS